MADDAVLWVGNDNLIEVRSLRSSAAAEGEYKNSATVTVTLRDGDGAEVGVTSGSISWPVTLSYVGGSDGRYQATLPDTLDLTVGNYYEAELIADAGSGLKAKWLRSYQAKKRV